MSSSPSAPEYIADFDSASAMLRSTSNMLAGRDFPALGQSRAMIPLAEAVNLLPKSARETVFALGGAFEGISPRHLDKVDAEAIAQWCAKRYPQRQYPVVAIGSSNGALVHLSAALDMPWLPQTTFIPVRFPGSDPDQPKLALEFGKEYAPLLLQANPELQAHQMHDANQDRLMVSYMSYFRVKRRTLGPAYEAFLDQCLAPDGTILIVDCTRTWPTKRLGDRYVFQHGALGGATEKEFHEGSPRVEEYLERYGSDVRRWDSPEPDGESPEAEWGFEQAMGEDILRYAQSRGRRVLRLRFQEPHDLSPVVADFYRDWYARRGLRANRLLIECFVMHDPYWALCTGSVPYWMTFNMEPSLEAAEAYLGASEPYDEINLLLFNHGVEAVGFPKVAQWKNRVLKKARKRGRLIGVREDLYPRDFGALGRYSRAIQEIPSRYPLPGGIPLAQFEDFVQARGDTYKISLSDG